MSISGGSSGGSSKKEDSILDSIDNLLLRKPAEYNLIIINERIKEKVFILHTYFKKI